MCMAKVWCLCDANNKYVYNFNVYVGAIGLDIGLDVGLDTKLI